MGPTASEPWIGRRPRLEIRGDKKGWVGELAQQRLEHLPKKLKKQHDAIDEPSPAQARAAVKASTTLIELGVPDKIAHRHAEALKAEVGAIGELALVTHSFDAWRKKAVDRVLGQFYKTLGAALTTAPAESGPRIAKAMIGALGTLMSGLGDSEALHPAISSAVSLFDTELRLAAQKRLALDPRELGARFVAATQTVGALVRGLEGRSGIGASLNLLPSIVEQLARRVPHIEARELLRIVDEARMLLTEVGPRGGLDQIAASRLSRSLSIAITEPHADVPAVLTATAQRFLATYADAHAQLVAQLGEGGGQAERIVATRELHAAINQSLRQLAKAHPTARPSLGAAAVELKVAVRKSLIERGKGAAELAPFYRAISGLIASLGDGPYAEPMLGFVKRLLGAAAHFVNVAPLLEAAAESRDPGLIAAKLLSALFEPPIEAAVKKALDGFAKNGGGAALKAVLALDAEPIERGHELEIIATAKRLAAKGADLDAGAYREHLDRIRSFTSLLEDNHYQLRGMTLAQRGTLASSLADATRRPLSEEHGEALIALLAPIFKIFPKADLGGVFADGAEGAAKGLLSASDPRTNFKAPMDAVLGQLLRGVAKAHKKTSPALTSAISTAIDLTFLIGRLDGRYQIPYDRIRKDFIEAHLHPRKLTYLAGGGELRARATSSVEAYLEAHPAMPRELALTAGLHLDRPRLQRLSDRIAGINGRDTIRELRDFVFGCVTAERLPLFDLVLGDKLDPRLALKAIAMVATEYREGRLAKLDFDGLLRGLRRGEDPMAEMQAAATQGALGKLKFQGPLDPQGVAEINKCGDAIRNLSEYTRAGMVVDDIDMGVMKAPFEAALQSIADGSWPAAKYDTALGRKILGKLTLAQQAIWRSPTVVDEKDLARLAPIDPQAPDPRLVGVRAAAKGLGEILGAIELRHPQLGPIQHDLDAKVALESLFDRQLEQLRKAEKGSDAHRGLVDKIQPTRSLLALLKLELALSRLPGRPNEILAKVKLPLEEALSSIRRLGVAAATDVASELLGLAQMIAGRKPSAQGGERSGRYAIDEDNLESLIMSTTGGCIHHDDDRRWANTNLLVNPHEKMIRTYDDGEFKYRACLKVIELKAGEYRGPALWLNEPNANDNGEDPHKELLLLQAVTKARAMGIPIVATPGYDFDKAPEKLGLKQKKMHVDVYFDDGATGSTFTDYAMDHNIREARGKEPKYRKKLDLYVVMPK